MINIRFHVVSLVAVFLALGVGVAMGASFIDRATVENMRGRVDDLETRFRERGDRLGAYREMVQLDDEAALDLTGADSRAIDGVLAGQALVLVNPTEIPEGVSDVIADVLQNAGAEVVGSIELQSSLTPASARGELEADDVGALRAAIGVDPTDSAEPATGEDLVSHARSVLAESLAVLSAAPPPTPQGAGPAEGGGGDLSGPIGVAEARETLERFGEAGLISLDGAGLPVDAAFPAVSSVRYVLVLAVGTNPSAADWVVPFVEDYGKLSRATMLVAGTDSLRNNGELATRAESTDELATLLEPLRSGTASDAVTTVQAATEPLARLSVVFGVQAASEGVVGHYGLGAGVTTPYPPVVKE